MKYYYSLSLFLVTGAMFAQETEVLPTLPSDAPQWLHFVWLAFGVIILPYILSFLRSKKQEADAEAEKFKFDANMSLLEQKNYLIDKRIIPYLWSMASYLAEKQLPTLLLAITTQKEGEKKFDWSKYAQDLKTELLEDVKEKFAAESIDIVKILGEKYLGELIDRAIARAIPWLPQSTQPIFESISKDRGGQLATLIMNRGLEAAKTRWLKEEKDK